jgi:hypothetical protein
MPSDPRYTATEIQSECDVLFKHLTSNHSLTDQISILVIVLMMTFKNKAEDNPETIEQYADRIRDIIIKGYAATHYTTARNHDRH